MSLWFVFRSDRKHSFSESDGESGETKSDGASGESDGECDENREEETL